MTLGEIYTYINAIIAKEVEGNTFNPVTFNAALIEVNLAAYKQEYDMLEKQAKAQGKPLYQLLFSSSPLRVFTETKSGSAGTNIITLSTIDPAFEYFIALTVLHSNLYKDVELVDLAEMNYRRSNVDGMNLYENPIVSLFSDKLRMLPTDINGGGTELIYLRLPEEPFFDYYITSSGKAYYMPTDYNAVKIGDTYTIYDGVVEVATGVTLPNNTTGSTPYNSKSVELEWKTSYHSEIVKRLLMKAGVTIRDGFVIQSQGV